MSILQSVGGGILGFVVALVPLIILHELGHMFAAKSLGVWVREFGIGYPPRMLKLFKWQETVFTLNWLPIGGFARMEGEEFVEQDAAMAEHEVDEDRPSIEEVRAHSLYAQSPFRRILIYLAGPAMNLLTAWVLSILIFAVVVPTTDVHIAEVSAGSPAEAAGLQVDDWIVSVAGEPVAYIDTVVSLTDEHLGEELSLTVVRNGERVEFQLIPRLDPPEGEGAMGIRLEATGYMPFGQAFMVGTQQTYIIIREIVLLPLRILQNQMPAEAARPLGVVSISRLGAYTIQQSREADSLYPIFMLLVSVSISLGIFNLLPIPALDGGRILFTLIEMVRRKPLSPEVQERIHMVAFFLLILIFVVITVLDIVFPVDFLGL